MKLNMFDKFTKYENLTWQQVEIVLAVSRAIQGEDKKKISVKSGHGIGKSSIISIIIIWFLFCYYHAVIGCTAPTQIQMQDVLRKELALWKDRLPDGIKDLFEHTQNYLRV
jgi:tRNA(Met) C34 N-acetyltransferase TmcA